MRLMQRSELCRPVSEFCLAAITVPGRSAGTYLACRQVCSGGDSIKKNVKKIFFSFTIHKACFITICTESFYAKVSVKKALFDKASHLPFQGIQSAGEMRKNIQVAMIDRLHFYLDSLASFLPFSSAVAGHAFNHMPGPPVAGYLHFFNCQRYLFRIRRRTSISGFDP